MHVQFYCHANAILFTVLYPRPLAFIFPHLKALFTTPSRGCPSLQHWRLSLIYSTSAMAVACLDVRNRVGDHHGPRSVDGDVVFSFGHRLLNFQSARVTYLLTHRYLSIWFTTR